MVMEAEKQKEFLIQEKQKSKFGKIWFSAILKKVC
jgi:hypothetical protein